MTTPPFAYPLSEALDRLLLGEGPRYTRDEVIAASGVGEPLARALWRAMGYPDTGGAAVFTDADVRALTIVRDLRDAGVVDDAVAIVLARGLGQTTSRLADWQVDALGRYLVDAEIIEPGTDATVDPEARAVVEASAQQLIPALEELLSHVWRRQVASVVHRRLATPEEPLGETAAIATVGFADLVGFTRLARQMEDDDLAALVERFESVSADVVAATGAELVKTVGDEILFVAPDPVTAARTALGLHRAHADDPDVPEMRVGLATGPMLRRMGDVFGSTVNLASRFTALARPGTTLVDAVTARALSHAGGYLLRQTPPRRVRGVGIVRAFALQDAN